MITAGDVVTVATESAQPWRVIAHGHSQTAAFELVQELDVAEYTLRNGPPRCTEYSVLRQGLDGDRAVVVPVTEVVKPGKSAWFLTGRGEG